MEFLRQQMGTDPGITYLDHAGVSPLPIPTRQAIQDWTADVSAFGVLNWKRWRGEVEKARSHSARLLNASTDEIALIHSTTEGINLVTLGFPWQSGDNVVTPTGEFPSNLYPWLMLEQQGVEIRQVKMPAHQVDLNLLKAACDARTRMITCSWIGFGHGFRVDLNDLVTIAREQNCFLFLDAIQGLGIFPLDVQQTPIDFLAADSHKWMLGPEGAGLFYCRQEHLDLLQPMGVGWNSVVNAADFDHPELELKKSAQRYEGGTYNMVGITGMRASLELLLNIGIPQINQSIEGITQYASERLQQAGCPIYSDRSEKHWSGIVSFERPGIEPRQLQMKANSAGLVLNARNGKNRISPHAYNNQKDIDKLIEFLLEL